MVYVLPARQWGTLRYSDNINKLLNSFHNKIWWLCLLPTSTSRFASDVGWPHAAGLQGAGPAGPLPRGAAGQGKAFHRVADHGAQNSGHCQRHAGNPCQPGEHLVHVQIPSLWHIHHPSCPERLWQRPQPQDHQPECHLHRPVQKPQGHVPGLLCGQAGVPRRQWSPDSRLPRRYDHEGPQLHGDWLQPSNTREILLAQHPVPRRGLSRCARLWTRLPALNGKADLSCGGGEHKDCPDTAGGIIRCHTLTMAAGHCASGVRHQCPVRRKWRQQQQQWWGGGNSAASS